MSSSSSAGLEKFGNIFGNNRICFEYVQTKFLALDPTEYKVPRKQWNLLNRFRTAWDLAISNQNGIRSGTPSQITVHMVHGTSSTNNAIIFLLSVFNLIV